MARSSFEAWIVTCQAHVLFLTFTMFLCSGNGTVKLLSSKRAWSVLHAVPKHITQQ